MITIISATNREDNGTRYFAQYIERQIRLRTGDEVQLIDLSELPADVLHNGMYEQNGQSSTIRSWQDDFMIPSDKYWFVIPEYNGSFPGILKLFIDALSIRKLQTTFAGKKACITGVATGRAGNLRGMDHLTDILNHLLVVVYPNKLPISKISGILNDQGEITHQGTEKDLQAQIEEFLSF